jgi:predicted TIM-barrel fold metal-dependent hydrolase
MITADQAPHDLDRLGLDEEARALFLAGNAARVFSLPYH